MSIQNPANVHVDNMVDYRFVPKVYRVPPTSPFQLSPAILDTTEQLSSALQRSIALFISFLNFNAIESSVDDDFYVQLNEWLDDDSLTPEAPLNEASLVALGFAPSSSFSVTKGLTARDAAIVLQINYGLAYSLTTADLNHLTEVRRKILDNANARCDYHAK